MAPEASSRSSQPVEGFIPTQPKLDAARPSKGEQLHSGRLDLTIGSALWQEFRSQLDPSGKQRNVDDVHFNIQFEVGKRIALQGETLELQGVFVEPDAHNTSYYSLFVHKIIPPESA